MNAHIESFRSILENECYSQNEFENYMEVYSIVSDYMKYYNGRRRYGGIKFMAPNRLYEAFVSDIVKIEFSA